MLALAFSHTREGLLFGFPKDVQNLMDMERKRQETDAGIVIWKPRDNMLIIKMHCSH